MNRRFLNLLAVTVIGVAWLAGCNDDGARTEPSAPVSTAAPTITAGVDTSVSPQWLYVMEATGGSGADGTFTLRGVNRNAISFTDRPARLVRRIPVETVVSSWSDLGFSDDPPNASLAFDRDGVEQVQTVTLTNPVFDGDEITFSYTPLTDGAHLVIGEPTDELPAQFGPASLFIDASDSTVGGAIGVGSDDASLYIDPYHYSCGSDECWGVLYGQYLTTNAEWEVFLAGETTAAASGTVAAGGVVNQVSLNLPCGTGQPAYAKDQTDGVNTGASMTDPSC